MRLVRIPVIVITQSGMVIIQSWYRDRRREKADHSSERSDGDNSCCEPPLRRMATRHLTSFVFVHENDRPCGPLWAARSGRRPTSSWETRFVRFPQLGHGPQALRSEKDRPGCPRIDDRTSGRPAASPQRAPLMTAFMRCPSCRAAFLGRASSVLSA